MMHILDSKTPKAVPKMGIKSRSLKKKKNSRRNRVRSFSGNMPRSASHIIQIQLIGDRLRVEGLILVNFMFWYEFQATMCPAAAIQKKN